MATLSRPKRKQKNVEMAPPRAQEEVVGSLLPPSALPRAIPVQQTSAVEADAAVPVTAPFAYEDTIQQDEDDEFPASAPTEEEDLPTAPFLPQYEDRNSRERKEAVAVQQGKQKGRIEAEAEKDDIRRAARDIYAINYHTKEGVKDAVNKGRLRNLKGVEVERDQYYKPELLQNKKAAVKDPDLEPFNKTGEYEVSDYDTSEYTTSEYDVREYKSVYEK